LEINFVAHAAQKTSSSSPRLHCTYRAFPFEKMAMNGDHTLPNNTMNKDTDLDQKTASPSLERDAEKGASKSRFGTSNRAAGGRIAPVLPHLRGYDFGDSSDAGSDILGKQIELEAGNDIQYRTCSWPKVCCDFILADLPLRLSVAMLYSSTLNSGLLDRDTSG
jgi:hypothetical protein